MKSAHQPPNMPDAEIYPFATLLSVSGEDPPWAPQKIAERLDQQVDLLRKRGAKTSRTACLSASGLDERTWRNLRDGTNPTIETVVKLAAGFRMTIGQVIGTEPLGQPTQEPGQNLMLLRAAMGMGEEAIRRILPEAPFTQETVDKLAVLTAIAYRMFAVALSKDPNALSNDMARSMIADRLSAELANADPGNP